MSMLFEVNIEHEVIKEFVEEFESVHQTLEDRIVSLEQLAFTETVVKDMWVLVNTVLVSSTKLNLVPLSESLDDMLRVIHLMKQHNHVPRQMSEFLLLLLDRLLYLVRDVERRSVIDIRETQLILVALQKILVDSSSNNFDQGVDNAILAITKNIELNLEEIESSDIDLFDDDEATKPTSPDLLIQSASIDPLAFSSDVIKTFAQDKPFMLLATIADQSTAHGESHTMFLLELGLALNYIAGNPIDAEDLAYGIGLHDIGLAALVQITNKPGKLTTHEMAKIREHPVNGGDLAMALGCKEDAIFAILQHHERMDGTGYPYNLKGDEISDAGKLTAIIDSFHAMVDNRPHRKFARSALRAIAEINACVGSHYDQKWVKYFNILMKKHWLPARRT